MTQSPQVPGNSELVTRAWEHRLTGIVRQGHDKPSVGMAEGDYEALVRLSDVVDALSTAEATIASLRGEVERKNAALKPFAEIADGYSSSEDEDVEVWKDFDVLGASLPLRIFRTARAAIRNLKEAGNDR